MVANLADRLDKEDAAHLLPGQRNQNSLIITAQPNTIGPSLEPNRRLQILGKTPHRTSYCHHIESPPFLFPLYRIGVIIASMEQFDLVAIGDITSDAFIKIREAEVRCDEKNENCKKTTVELARHNGERLYDRSRL